MFSVSTPAQQAGDAGSRPELPADVIAGFVAGSTDALGQIYDRFSRPVWSVVAKMLGNSALIDDAVQETFLRAWRSADRFDASRPLAPWLFTIARRAAIDALRKEMRPTRGDHDEPEDLAVAPPDFVSLWQVWEVRSAIDRLTSLEQEVVRLSHLEGLTHEEISIHLDVPLGTVKSRSHRAHRRLAALLSHLAEDSGEGAEYEDA